MIQSFHQVGRAKKAPPVDHNQDEAYLTRFYGKALYQARRSTMQKEPYLKYATSSPGPKPSRIPPAAEVKGEGSSGLIGSFATEKKITFDVVDTQS